MVADSSDEQEIQVPPYQQIGVERFLDYARYMQILGATPMAVYFCMMRHWNWRDCVSYPALRTMSLESGVTKSTVHRAIKRLANEDHKLSEHSLPPLVIKGQRPPAKRGGRPNAEYRLPVHEADHKAIQQAKAAKAAQQETRKKRAPPKK